MDITIRKAEDADYTAVLALIKEFAAFQKTPEKVSITAAQMQEDKSIFQCLVAQTNAGTIVGFASFFFAYYSWSGKAVYLDDLYVTEAYRNKKIGIKLLHTVLETGRRAGCKTMRWVVSDWNTDAIAFYKNLGATIDQTDRVCNLELK